MLEYIRERATGLVAWGIILLIIIPFAFWGIQEYFTPELEQTVAEVGDIDISYTQYTRAYSYIREQLQASANNTLQDQALIQNSTMTRLLRDAVVEDAAIKSGLTVSDAQLVNAIRTQPTFNQGEDGFSEVLYRSWLYSQGYTPTAFEQELKRTLLRQQIETGVSQSAFVTDGEFQEIMRLQLQMRTFSVLVFSRGNFSPEQPTEQELEDYYTANSQQFIRPEENQVQYLKLSKSDIATAIEVQEHQIKTLYETQKESYKESERVNARHILLAVEGEDEVVWDKAIERAKELKAEIEDGADFADFATKYSDDTSSAKEGGSLGFFDRGIMVPAFEKVAFSQPIAKISDPVRTQFGIHLIEVTEREENRIPPLEELEASLIEEIQNREAEQIYYENVDRLANLAYENPKSLEVASEQLGMEIEQSPWFSARGGGDIFGERLIIDAAFSTEVLNEGNNSEVIELADDRAVVLRLLDSREQSQIPFEEVKTQIVQTLLHENSMLLAKTEGEQALEKLKQNITPEQVAG